jgi:hypothetical protein
LAISSHLIRRGVFVIKDKSERLRRHRDLQTFIKDCSGIGRSNGFWSSLVI